MINPSCALWPPWPQINACAVGSGGPVVLLRWTFLLPRSWLTPGPVSNLFSTTAGYVEHTTTTSFNADCYSSAFSPPVFNNSSSNTKNHQNHLILAHLSQLWRRGFVKYAPCNFAVAIMGSKQTGISKRYRPSLGLGRK